MAFLRNITTAVLLFSVAATVHASTYVDVEDDVYILLSRLEAEGVIRDALLSTKPLSRREIVRLLHEAETNAEGRSEFIKSLVRDLKQSVRPEEFESGGLKLLDRAYVKYINTDADVLTLVYGFTREKEQAFNYNNNGDLYSRGSNYRAGFTSRAENWGLFSLYLNPEFRSSKGEQAVLKKGYGVLGFSRLDIVLGRDSLWWGPGYNGSILLSNNAEPFTMLKLTGPEPVILPWIFKYLGPFQYTIFATRLEKDRNDFPEPYLWGMRFELKPHPVLELGFQRTALLGGRGRAQGLNTWVNSLLGTEEHERDFSRETGDQRAGWDLKLTLPFKLQPLQMYWEGDGEDGIHGWPSQWAKLYGIYLPRVLSLERISLRGEYATTHMNKHPGAVWYTHHIYTAGYTYNGMIIGHHMGSDSNDLFSELSFLIPEKNSRVFIHYDRVEHNLSNPDPGNHEILDEVAAGVQLALTRSVDLKAVFNHGRLKNRENTPHEAVQFSAFGVEMTYRF